MDDGNQSNFEEPKKKFKTDKPIKQLSLFDAVAKNDVQQLNYLLDLRQNHGVDIDLNEKDALGRTPLHKAAISNKGQSHFELIQVLLNNGADINARNYCSRTPLWYLVKNCNLEILKLFLRFKPDLENPDYCKSSILIPTVKNGDNLHVVKFLVEVIGLDINHRNVCGDTPLHKAAMCNLNDSHYEVLKYLLDKGADVNARDNRGCTPLYYLVRRGNWRVVKLFFKHNVDLNSVNDHGRCILFAFDDKNSDFQVLKKLINDYGLVVNHEDKYQCTPLQHIIMSYSLTDDQNIKIIKCLLKNGANFKTYDKDGLTPIISAVRYIREDEDDWFLENLNYFNFLIDQTNFSIVHNDQHIFYYYYIYEYHDGEHQPHSKYLWKWILEHLAKLKFLNFLIHPLVLEFVENHDNYKNYFEKCAEELKLMSETKPQNSWINFFNLLVDRRKKLKNYAGNKDLIEDYEKNDWLMMFPIYGALLKKSIKKGIKRRKLFDQSSSLLSECVPIFNFTHLIIKDILDCILSKKDLTKFCGN